jgi:hypothetical protein
MQAVVRPVRAFRPDRHDFAALPLPNKGNGESGAEQATLRPLERAVVRRLWSAVVVTMGSVDQVAVGASDQVGDGLLG